MTLKVYQSKRRFRVSPEPQGKVGKKIEGKNIFVVQKHDASHLHYDFRLSSHGVLKSWAVPKGPPTDYNEKHLAVEVEDHPLEYAKFHGKIPKGNYGAGMVEIWDRGTYTTKYHDDEKWEFYLRGKKLRGMYTLVKLKNNKLYGKDNKANWLMLKVKEHEITAPAKLIKVQKKSKILHDIEPMMATMVSEPFNDKDWLFEVKWDGYRAIAEIQHGGVRLYSRNKQSFIEKYPQIIEELQAFKHDLVLDGEIIALDSRGRPSFQKLQDYKKNDETEIVYYVFDVLYIDGVNVSEKPLIERRKILDEIMPKKGRILASQTIDELGKEFFEVAKKEGLEGIVAKNKTSTYIPGVRSKSWLKIKTALRQEAIICGFTESRTKHGYFAALVLGVYEGREIKYVGHTGTGFDENSKKFLFEKFKKIIQKESPFKVVPKTNTPVTWVKPILVCEVKFAEWTGEGIMRQSVFLGLREDKPVIEVRREVESRIDVVGGLPTKKFKIDYRQQIVVNRHKFSIANLDKIFWPKEKYTKGDLLNYYRQIAPYLLPYLKDRPESLKRYPDGIEGNSFFHKNVEDHPSWVKTIAIKSESDDKIVHYVLCQDEATLVYLINLGCIDINPWNSRVGKEDKPDFMILDLDPEEISFDHVVRTALATHSVMDRAGIPNYVKTSGASGIHIYCPLEGKYSYEQVRQLAQIIAIKVNQKLPKITSLERSPDNRQGKVYIDCFQNAKGQTLAAPYSVRPELGATVSAPLEWSEVNKKLRPGMFTMKNMPLRLKHRGDIFKPVLGKGFDMLKVLDRLNEKLK